MMMIVALTVPPPLPLATGLELPQSRRNAGHHSPRPPELTVWTSADRTAEGRSLSPRWCLYPRVDDIRRAGSASPQRRSLEL